MISDIYPEAHKIKIPKYDNDESAYADLSPPSTSSKAAKDVKLANKNTKDATIQCKPDSKKVSKKDKSKETILDKIVRADSPVAGSKRKKARILSSSSEDDEPLQFKSKKRFRGIREQQNEFKNCSVIIDRFRRLPDAYTYGALLKKHHSRKSRHPYTIKRWLKSNEKIVWEKRLLRSVENLSSTKNAPILPLNLVDASDVVIEGTHLKERVKRNELQGKYFYNKTFKMALFLMYKRDIFRTRG